MGTARDHRRLIASLLTVVGEKAVREFEGHYDLRLVKSLSDILQLERHLVDSAFWIAFVRVDRSKTNTVSKFLQPIGETKPFNGRASQNPEGVKLHSRLRDLRKQRRIEIIDLCNRNHLTKMKFGDILRNHAAVVAMAVALDELLRIPVAKGLRATKRVGDCKSDSEYYESLPPAIMSLAQPSMRLGVIRAVIHWRIRLDLCRIPFFEEVKDPYSLGSIKKMIERGTFLDAAAT